MINIVGIRFHREGKVYHFNASHHFLEKNDCVIVQTDQGLALGRVELECQSVSMLDWPAPLKDVLRKATADDLRKWEDNQNLEKEAFRYCQEKIRGRSLPMKLISVTYLFDRSQMIFFFYAENRVDFRELVKDLVQRFRTRIELRQIGARQETRMVRGLGVCGREICCVNLLQNLDRVTIKMAKEQNLSLNPEKISGLCGRLMCCLAYEYDSYLDMKKPLPKCGKTIQTAEGRGKVIRQNVIRGEVVVLLEGGKEVTLKTSDLTNGS